jgi:hypothetical protein
MNFIENKILNRLKFQINFKSLMNYNTLLHNSITKTTLKFRGKKLIKIM